MLRTAAAPHTLGRVPPVFLSTRGLIATGWSEEDLYRAVRDGRLLRARRGRYLWPDTHPDVVSAVALGGRLDCISLLAVLGVFVHSHDSRHIAVDRAASRLPTARGVIRHWRDGHARDAAVSDVVAAAAQATRCQPPRYALATLDSAVHHGLLDEERLAGVFDRLPRRFQALRPLVDGRCESGPETLMRLMLRTIGAHFELQVEIPRVGRVDFVVDGWLIIECDSRAHHSDWAQQCRDRRRDLEAAAQGYTTIRPVAEDIMYRGDEIRPLVLRVVASHAGRIAAQRPRSRR